MSQIKIWLLVVVILALPLSTPAHDTHVADWQVVKNIITSGWITDVGFVIGQDTNLDGSPDTFYLIYKDGDLTHQCLHVKRLP